MPSGYKLTPIVRKSGGNGGNGGRKVTLLGHFGRRVTHSIVRKALRSLFSIKGKTPRIRKI